MTTKPISIYVAPALVLTAAVLTAWNWYLQPERVVAWGSTAVLLGCMTLALYFARRRPTNESARGHAGDTIRSAVVFAGLTMVISLGMKLAFNLGAFPDGDLSRRAAMVLSGAFLMFIGNAMPKMLTPLSALRCDAARVQAFQRIGGWTWVLTGLGIAFVWLALPVDLAKPVSVGLILCGMLVIVGQIVRLRWM